MLEKELFCTLKDHFISVVVAWNKNFYFKSCEYVSFKCTFFRSFLLNFLCACVDFFYTLCRSIETYICRTDPRPKTPKRRVLCGKELSLKRLVGHFHWSLTLKKTSHPVASSNLLQHILLKISENDYIGKEILLFCYIFNIITDDSRFLLTVRYYL